MSGSGHIVYKYNMRTVERKYAWKGWRLVRKIAIMVVSLVRESLEESNKEIEEEILKGLEEARTPWVGKVEKVTVLESDDD